VAPLLPTPAPVDAVVVEGVGDDRLLALAVMKEEEAAAGSFVPQSREEEAVGPSRLSQRQGPILPGPRCETQIASLHAWR